MNTDDNEIWTSFPAEMKLSLYRVSNQGKICSYAKKLPTELKGNVRSGYIVVRLVLDDKKRKQFFLHRLIATAFIPNPDHLPTVDHIDRNRSNNRVSNLRWASQKEQVANRDLRMRDENCRNKKARPVLQENYDDNHKIQRFSSLTDAMQWVNKQPGFENSNSGNLWSAINRQRLYCGCMWKYETNGDELEEFVPANLPYNLQEKHPLKISKSGKIMMPNGRITNGSSDRRGYKTINVENHELRVHRLVLLTFEGKSEDPLKNSVNHKDGNKANNTLENLEWMTCKQNNIHRFQMEKNQGISHNRYKVAQYDINGNYLRTFPSVQQASKFTNIKVCTIRIGLELNGKVKRHTGGGYFWRRVEFNGEEPALKINVPKAKTLRRKVYEYLKSTHDLVTCYKTLTASLESENLKQAKQKKTDYKTMKKYMSGDLYPPGITYFTFEKPVNPVEQGKKYFHLFERFLSG